MAHIPVEKTSRGGGFLPWLLGLLVLALLGWALWALLDDDEAEVAVVPAPTTATTPEPRTGTTAGAATVDLAAILENPQAYAGESFPTTEVRVADVPTDRGFWIEHEGARLFAIVVDQPSEQPKDINPGQTLRVTGGTLRAPSYLSELPGMPLDAQTEATAREQDVFLVVDERNLDVLERGTPQPGTDPAQSLQ